MWQQLEPGQNGGRLGIAEAEHLHDRAPSARPVFRKFYRAPVCEDERMSEIAQPPLPDVPGKHPWYVGRLITAWAVATVIGVLVTVFVQGEARFQWLIFAIGVSTLVTFALQLGTAQRVGFITRTSYSVAGSVLIIAVIDVVGILIG